MAMNKDNIMRVTICDTNQAVYLPGPLTAINLPLQSKVILVDDLGQISRLISVDYIKSFDEPRSSRVIAFQTSLIQGIHTVFTEYVNLGHG